MFKVGQGYIISFIYDYKYWHFIFYTTVDKI